MTRVSCRQGEKCAYGDFVHSAAEVAHRRSQRLPLEVRLVIRGESTPGHSFQEETFTVSVSPHGALVLLASRVKLKQKVVLIHPKNWDEQEGSVVYLEQSNAFNKVGIELAQPAPEFWCISPLPPDWKVS